MYVPGHFREDRASVLHDAMQQIGFATLVTHGPDGLEANHLPFLLDAEKGVLRCHVARANPVWKNAQGEGLAVFLGPHAYVTPAWYPSKAEGGKAVPTWNYIAVHARGPLSRFHDADRLRAHVGALSAAHEAERENPWAIEDAPAGYIDSMLRGIVGLELTIARLEGKWKLSQNREPRDRDGVRDGLLRDGGDARRDVARLMDPPMGGT